MSLKIARALLATAGIAVTGTVVYEIYRTMPVMSRFHVSMSDSLMLFVYASPPVIFLLCAFAVYRLNWTRASAVLSVTTIVVALFWIIVFNALTFSWPLHFGVI